MGKGSSAIHRTRLSTPARVIYHAGLIRGRLLDYCCGYGYDAKWFRSASYDPIHQPVLPKGTFDTVLCIYVLNTINNRAERDRVVERIRGLLRGRGRAFIAVRRDVKGFRLSSKGWQGGMDVPGGVSLWRNSRYEIYVIGR